jgi:hypothetical protein
MPAKWIATRELPLADLERFPGNARRGDVDEIRKSIARHGQYRAIVVRQHDDRYTVLAGNHTADALEAEGSSTARCELIECSDDEAVRINLADNRTAELGGYDNEALAALLSTLDNDYDGTGWAEEDITAILEESDGVFGGDGEWDGGDGEPAPNRGELLALAGVTIGEPRHKVETGQVWALGDHRLVIADLFTGWEAWAPLLDGEVTFLPYPTPLAPHAPGYGPLIMVQPEEFLAGHLLDKWQDITGGAPVVVNAEVAAA